MDETAYSNDYVETASLLEKVLSASGFLEIFALLYDLSWIAFFFSKEMRPGTSEQSGLNYISGIICQTKILMFERMLFRATRGNMLFNQATANEGVMDPVTSEMVLFFTTLPEIGDFFLLFSVLELPNFFCLFHSLKYFYLSSRLVVFLLENSEENFSWSVELFLQRIFLF